MIKHGGTTYESPLDFTDLIEPLTSPLEMLFVDVLGSAVAVPGRVGDNPLPAAPGGGGTRRFTDGALLKDGTEDAS